MTDTTNHLPSASAPVALPLRPGRWTLDRFHSSVGFAVRHLGISKVRGTFEHFDVAVQIGETLDSTSVVAEIDLTTIDTGNADRDAHVQSADFLDVAVRPIMRFESTGVSNDGEAWRLDGDLTIGTVTRGIGLEVEFGGVETFPVDGRVHAGFEASATIDRHDFGLDFGVLDAGLGRRIQVRLDIQLCEPADDAGVS